MREKEGTREPRKEAAQNICKNKRCKLIISIKSCEKMMIQRVIITRKFSDTLMWKLFGKLVQSFPY